MTTTLLYSFVRFLVCSDDKGSKIGFQALKSGKIKSKNIPRFFFSSQQPLLGPLDCTACMAAQKLKFPARRLCGTPIGKKQILTVVFIAMMFFVALWNSGAGDTDDPHMFVDRPRWFEGERGRGSADSLHSSRYRIREEAPNESLAAGGLFRAAAKAFGLDILPDESGSDFSDFMEEEDNAVLSGPGSQCESFGGALRRKEHEMHVGRNSIPMHEQEESWW